MNSENTNSSANGKEQFFNGMKDIIDEKIKVQREDRNNILKKYWAGKLATVDQVPSVFVHTLENKKGEWKPYFKSDFYQSLLSESDLAINNEYRMYKNFNYQIPNGEFDTILGMLFAEQKIDTFQEWVKTLTWDGIDRMSSLGRAMGLSVIPRGQEDRFKIISREEEDLYIQNVIQILLVGTVQRHFEPFIQQVIPIIVGDGGVGKSESLRALSLNKWYGSIQGIISPENNGREFYRLQFGKVLVELKEIDNLLRKDNTGLIKALFDSEYAEFNEKHEKGIKKIPLTGICVGTTNEDSILHDKTGNRRFLLIYMYRQQDTPNREAMKDTDISGYLDSPIFLGINDEDHKKFIEQLYAQAYYNYLNGEKYDFYYKDNSIIQKIQKLLNETALIELEGMVQLVAKLRYECENCKYGNNSVKWTDFCLKFEQEFSSSFSKSDFKELYKSFKENPRRFGFSNYKAIRMSLDQIGKGYQLEDPDLCDRFLKGLIETNDY